MTAQTEQNLVDLVRAKTPPKRTIAFIQNFTETCLIGRAMTALELESANLHRQKGASFLAAELARIEVQIQNNTSRRIQLGDVFNENLRAYFREKQNVRAMQLDLYALRDALLEAANASTRNASTFCFENGAMVQATIAKDEGGAVMEFVNKHLISAISRTEAILEHENRFMATIAHINPFAAARDAPRPLNDDLSDVTWVLGGCAWSDLSDKYKNA